MIHYPAPILDRKIRFALAGCGRIAKNHFEAIAKQSDRAELVAVCDVDPKALDAAVRATGAKSFARLDKMLAGCNADIVALCTPSGLHPEQAIEIAHSGRHLMTEKPMANQNARVQGSARW